MCCLLINVEMPLQIGVSFRRMASWMRGDGRGQLFIKKMLTELLGWK